MTLRTACAGLLALTLAACTTTEVVPVAEPEPRLPEATTAQLHSVLAEERTVLADDIVVHLTHDPFFTWCTFNGSPPNRPEQGAIVIPDQVVTRTEEGGALDGKLTITLTRAADAPPTEDTLARATIGDGLILLATRKIVLTYDLRPSPTRPAQVRVHAAGNVVLLKTSGEPRRQPGTEVKIDVDVVPVGDGFRVDQSEEVVP